MDHGRWEFSGGSETWCVRAKRESSSCVGANSALSEDFLEWIDSVFRGTGLMPVVCQVGV